MNPKNKLIVALDVDTIDKAVDLVRALKKDVKFFKIGLELFSSCGADIIGVLKKEGAEIFLDLKLHDIPNTVAKASRVITKLGVFMFNVHASGGYGMMEAAVKAVNDEARSGKYPRPKIIAVTVLTSMDAGDLKKIGINAGAEDQVLRLAGLAKDAGMDGVVASSAEIGPIRDKMGKDFMVVTPGVRPSWAGPGDQKRIATPGEAVSAGADYIVVGRPITGAQNPAEAARKILKETEE